MRRRAISLVVLTGILDLSAGLLVAQAPRKTIKSASDLPAFSYPITGSQDDLIHSDEAFRPLAEKLRADVESLLRDYAIEDRTTLRGLHQTLLTLDLLENRTAEARKEIAIVRDLQDRPVAKLMSVLFQEALLDSGWPKRDPQEFLRRFSGALNRLPWDVVGDRVKGQKGYLEYLEKTRPPANQNPPVDTPRIALEGNPFGRLVVVREGFPYQIPPPPPTLTGTRKFAAGASELTAYLRKHGAPVVNMSWTITLGVDFELQASGVGADALGRGAKHRLCKTPALSACRGDLDPVRCSSR